MPILGGNYVFCKKYESVEYSDTFELVFSFPQDYPNNPPIVNEIGGKIPNGFHRYSNGGLCLCSIIEQYILFSKNPTLENYMERLVNPYLLSWLYFKAHGVMPWGERAHGGKGLIESYKELLHIDNERNLLLFLRNLTIGTIEQRKPCPCGSGVPFRNCHKRRVEKVFISIPESIIYNDYMIIMGEKLYEK
jgi:hypothetical protein